MTIKHYILLAEDYLIHQAGSRQLNRLRKDDLLRLHDLAGLSDLDEDSTKSPLAEVFRSPSRHDYAHSLSLAKTDANVGDVFESKGVGARKQGSAA